MITLIQKIRKARFQRKVKKCIQQANEVNKLTKYKCYVLVIKGKPTVMKKVDVKENIKRGTFIKGTTIQDIEKTALYVTI